MHMPIPGIILYTTHIRKFIKKKYTYTEHRKNNIYISAPFKRTNYTKYF